MKRAERRHEEIKRRLKAKKEVKAEREKLEAIYQSHPAFLASALKKETHRTVGRDAGKKVNTPCQCSNPTCCGNPRNTVGRRIEKISEVKRMKEFDTRVIIEHEDGEI